jgi:tRNA A-37 threonylcarbamoyl transferase component Bud32
MNSRYQILGEINQGGVGVVLKAYDTKLQRNVAIKRFLSAEQRAAMGHMEGDLLKEASTLSAMHHPNIVSIYDVIVDSPEGPEVIMEYLNGQDLEQAVAQAALTLDDFYQVAQQTLDALSNAHKMNLLHRDIKPSNIQVTWLANGKFVSKFVDFGLAKFFEKPSKQTVRHDGTVMGSIYYMAPEQFERQPLDNRSDIYSLGCVFYFALTMHRPFEGETVHDVINAHLQGRSPRMRDYREDLPAELEKWVEWMMQRDPEQRPADAEVVLDALRKIIVGKVADEVPGIRNLSQPVNAAPMKSTAVPSGTAVTPARAGASRPAARSGTKRSATAKPAARRRWLAPVGIAAAVGVGMFFAFSGGKGKKGGELAKEDTKATPSDLLDAASREAELKRTKEDLAAAQARIAVESAAPGRTATSTPASNSDSSLQPPGAGLFVWLDGGRNTKADEKGAAAVVENPVGEWHDCSAYGGKAIFQYTRSSTKDKEANYPKLRMAGGSSSFLQPMPALAFDGKGDTLALRDRDKAGDAVGSAFNSGNVSVLMVYRSMGGDAPQGILTARSDDTPRWWLGSKDGGIVAGPGIAAPLKIAGTEKEFRILSFSVSGQNGKGQLALISRDGKKATAPLSLTPAPAGPVGELRMGSSDGSSNTARSLFEGQIAEVLVYDKTLDAAAQGEAENYLRQKYFGTAGPTVTVN